MSRDIDPVLEAAVGEPVVRPFLGLHIDLPDPVRAFTGIGTMDIDGDLWIGAGGIGAVDTVGESTDGSATGIKAQLNKVPSELWQDVADQATKGALFEVYVGTFDETFQTVEAFQLLWKGRLDQYNIIDGGETLTVEVLGESRQRDQFRPAIKRFTDEYQQRAHPGDLFFQYVPKMVEVAVLWAKAEPKRTLGSSAGGSLLGSVAAFSRAQ